jgi:hypothetical protein
VEPALWRPRLLAWGEHATQASHHDHRRGASHRQQTDAQEFAEIVGQARKQVFGSGEHEAAQAEHGEAPVFLQLPEDGLHDHLAASVAAPGVGLAE